MFFRLVIIFPSGKFNPPPKKMGDRSLSSPITGANYFDLIHFTRVFSLFINLPSAERFKNSAHIILLAFWATKVFFSFHSAAQKSQGIASSMSL